MPQAFGLLCQQRLVANSIPFDSRQPLPRHRGVYGARQDSRWGTEIDTEEVSAPRWQQFCLTETSRCQVWHETTGWWSQSTGATQPEARKRTFAGSPLRERVFETSQERCDVFANSKNGGEHYPTTERAIPVEFERLIRLLITIWQLPKLLINWKARERETHEQLSTFEAREPAAEHWQHRFKIVYYV